ncbi:type IV secretory system conjugative DNA transfer family protein [Clostridium botulinum]|nr:type IV secretory system conjugative DNA transfer family protein [Clostridium botulinum]NFK69451.1 type IV secretory system conjugative DNA transfer family protein [Clostridium botulinum]NFK97941.1 type IV secretory system conjugative DNA transfer family protein [Clostridium botulinum]
MDIIEQLKALLTIGGGGIVTFQTLSYLIKKYSNEIDKLASGEVKDRNSIKNILGKDGLILSKDIQIKEKFNFEGSLIIAPTGSGKTTSFFFNNLLSNNIRGSIVVTDPKEELFKSTSKYQEKICGRKVLKFSPLNPDNSERYNLLTNCKTNAEVIELASMLLYNGALSIELMTGKKTSGVEWIQMAEPLLSATLLYVKELEYPFNTIEFAFQLIINLSSDELEKLFKNSINSGVKTQFAIFKTVGGADRTEGSIKITLASNLKLFTDDIINKCCEKTTFNIEDFRKEETILYVTYPENQSSYIAPFIAPFFSTLMNKLINSYNKSALPITLLFDEFGNIGMLNNMSVNVATIRSRKISMNICLQSITQLMQIYGRENARAILNNLKTKIILPGLNDIDTLSYISDICGDKEITICNKNYNKNNISHSYSKTKIKLFEKSELRCLEDDEELLIISNKQPILTIQDRYYLDERYTNNIFKESSKTNKYNSYRINSEKKIKELKIDLEKDEIIEDVRNELFK